MSSPLIPLSSYHIPLFNSPPHPSLLLPLQGTFVPPKLREGALALLMEERLGVGAAGRAPAVPYTHVKALLPTQRVRENKRRREGRRAVLDNMSSLSLNQRTSLHPVYIYIYVCVSPCVVSLLCVCVWSFLIYTTYRHTHRALPNIPSPPSSVLCPPIIEP